MAGQGWFCGKTSWQFAFLLSAVLHVAGVLILLPLLGSRPTPAQECYPVLDVCKIVGEEVGGGSDAVVLFPRFGTEESATKKDVTAIPVVAHASFQAKLVFPPGGEPLVPDVPPLPGLNPGHGSGQTPGSGVGSSQGAGLKAGKSTFFQVPIRGTRIVYVIDRSSSMGKQGALQVAVQELLASLQSLPDQAQFQIIVYNSIAHHLLVNRPQWLQATEENKRLAAGALLELEATHGTVHNLALPMALALQPDVVFFLTDADDLDPRYLNDITRNNQSQSVIHVVELNTANRQRLDSPLQVFARQNNGTYHGVDLAMHSP